VANRLTAYLSGAMVGFLLLTASFMLLVPRQLDLAELMMTWTSLNLGSSAGFFLLVLVCFSVSLMRLQALLDDQAMYKQIAQLDQVSDIWIHVFVGIGVIWTAVGMRNALAATLDAPQALTQDAGGVLARLVDSGILLALTTTIVGAIGGYLMRLFKTLWLGTELMAFYHQHDRLDVQAALTQLSRIESLLEQHLQGTKDRATSTEPLAD